MLKKNIRDKLIVDTVLPTSPTKILGVCYRENSIFLLCGLLFFFAPTLIGVSCKEDPILILCCIPIATAGLVTCLPDRFYQEIRYVVVGGSVLTCF
jgi:hydrogenase-4 membrane subunit HyfE